MDLARIIDVRAVAHRHVLPIVRCLAISLPLGSKSTLELLDAGRYNTRVDLFVILTMYDHTLASLTLLLHDVVKLQQEYSFVLLQLLTVALFVVGVGPDDWDLGVAEELLLVLTR